jgi:hypothetical protein
VAMADRSEIGATLFPDSASRLFVDIISSLLFLKDGNASLRHQKLLSLSRQAVSILKIYCVRESRNQNSVSETKDNNGKPNILNHGETTESCCRLIGEPFPTSVFLHCHVPKPAICDCSRKRYPPSGQSESKGIDPDSIVKNFPGMCGVYIYRCQWVVRCQTYSTA